MNAFDNLPEKTVNLEFLEERNLPDPLRLELSFFLLVAALCKLLQVPEILQQP